MCVCVCKCVTAVYLEAAESLSGGNRVKKLPSHWLSRREIHPISCSRSPAVTLALARACTLPFAFYLITSSKGNPTPSCQTKPSDNCIRCYCHLHTHTRAHLSTIALAENEYLQGPTGSHTHARELLYVRVLLNMLIFSSRCAC